VAGASGVQPLAAHAAAARQQAAATLLQVILLPWLGLGSSCPVVGSAVCDGFGLIHRVRPSTVSMQVSISPVASRGCVLWLLHVLCRSQ
jgi:hypothetical protein